MSGQAYTDGGVADSIPVRQAYQQGYRELTVVLSQPLGYRKRPSRFPWLLRWALRDYPSLLAAMERRHRQYNQTLAFIAEPPEDCRIQVLVPPPVASSDEILAESGGMYYPRETPEHDVYVSKGTHFERGDPLYIVEVMKMFNKVYAPFSGTIDEVLVEGDGVIIAKGQPLFKITPDEVVVVESPEEKRARRRAATNGFLAAIGAS